LRVNRLAKATRHLDRWQTVSGLTETPEVA
jgi:hypothetical protein